MAVILEEVRLESGRAQRVVPLAVKQRSHCREGREGRGYSLDDLGHGIEECFVLSKQEEEGVRRKTARRGMGEGEAAAAAAAG